jgi:CO/xanthine dehydrogenase FAD-binding subunit
MRILEDFDYRRPASRAEALALLAEHRQSAAPLAGGTDLMVIMKHRSILQSFPGAGTPQAKFPTTARALPVIRPEVVVSLADVDGLEGVVENGTTYWVGPKTTMWDFAERDDVPAPVAALHDAASVMGSPLIRARATIGGNIINARPAADTAVATLGLGARYVLESVDGERRVDAADFYTGPGKSIRKPEELLTGIEIPTGPRQGSCYIRQGTRKQLEIALVCAGVWTELDDAGNIKDARVALGAVGPTPLLAPAAAEALVGQEPSPDLFAEAAKAARGDAKPIDDFRGGADYRLDLTEVLVERALTTACERAQGGLK